MFRNTHMFPVDNGPRKSSQLESSDKWTQWQNFPAHLQLSPESSQVEWLRKVKLNYVLISRTTARDILWMIWLAVGSVLDVHECIFLWSQLKSHIWQTMQRMCQRQYITNIQRNWQKIALTFTFFAPKFVAFCLASSKSSSWPMLA